MSTMRVSEISTPCLENRCSAFELMMLIVRVVEEFLRSQPLHWQCSALTFELLRLILKRSLRGSNPSECFTNSRVTIWCPRLPQTQGPNLYFPSKYSTNPFVERVGVEPNPQSLQVMSTPS